MREREALRAVEAMPAWQRLRELLDGEAVSAGAAQRKVRRGLGLSAEPVGCLTGLPGDGRLPIDNNETEQLMKQVAIGRKNWLFVGSVAAGKHAADFLSIVSSTVRNGLDVWAYVKEVLDRLLAGDRDYAALRPDRWAAEHPQHIRDYRADGAAIAPTPGRCVVLIAVARRPRWLTPTRHMAIVGAHASTTDPVIFTAAWRPLQMSMSVAWTVWTATRCPASPLS